MTLNLNHRRLIYFHNSYFIPFLNLILIIKHYLDIEKKNDELNLITIYIKYTKLHLNFKIIITPCVHWE